MMNKSKKKLCPQCKIGRFQVKNDAGESIVVIVNEDSVIMPVHESESIEGFNLDILYCLGCSWKGSTARLTSR